MGWLCLPRASHSRWGLLWPAEHQARRALGRTAPHSLDRSLSPSIKNKPRAKADGANFRAGWGHACLSRAQGFLTPCPREQGHGVHAVSPGEEDRDSLDARVQGGKGAEWQPGNVCAHSRNPAWPCLAAWRPRAAAINAGRCQPHPSSSAS